MPLIRVRALIPLALALVLLAACNFPRPGTIQPAGPETVLTFAAQTVEAQLTQAAGELQATLTPGNSIPTASLQPGETATATPPTTTTQGPTQTSEVCDRAAFVEDVNYPDGTIIAAGEIFTKTWRLENTGTCTWNSDYAIVFDHGDAMDSPASRSLTDGTVPPGEEIDVSLALTAPDSAGEYQGFWKLRNQAGQVFGLGSNADKEFWVKIRVGVVSGITYDFIAQASSAQWVASGGGEEVNLTYGGALDDPNGAAKVEGGHQLEDGANLGKALLTYPKHNGDGRITGTFPEYTVQDGDHFKGKVGLAEDCGDGQVVYQLLYKDSEGTERIREWDEACDGRATVINEDLSSLKGKKVQFILVVRADGSSQDDLAIWSSIRIER